MGRKKHPAGFYAGEVSVNPFAINRFSSFRIVMIWIKQVFPGVKKKMEKNAERIGPNSDEACQNAPDRMIDTMPGRRRLRELAAGKKVFSENKACGGRASCHINRLSKISRCARNGICKGYLRYTKREGPLASPL